MKRKRTVKDIVTVETRKFNNKEDENNYDCDGDCGDDDDNDDDGDYEE